MTKKKNDHKEDTYIVTEEMHRSHANTTSVYDDERHAAYRERNGIKTKKELAEEKKNSKKDNK